MYRPPWRGPAASERHRKRWLQSAATLGMCTLLAGCGQAMGARALPALPVGVTARTQEIRYEVTGTTVDEIRRSLRENTLSVQGQQARAAHRLEIKWSFRYAPTGSGCQMTNVFVDLESLIELPEWAERATADEDLAAAWDEYITSLRSHEYTHRELAYRAAREISRELHRLRPQTCGLMSSMANNLARRIHQKYRDLNSQFDDDSRGTITWPPRGSG